MSTRERIEQDFIREMKARNASAVSTLRMLRAALKNEDIAKMKPLDEQEVLAVVSREIKKLKDGLDSFVAGKREDLAEAARGELAFLQAYLPAQLTDDELRAVVAAKIAESGATQPKDMGKVVGLVMKDAQGKAEGGRGSTLVKEALTPRTS